jgi:hypothetical protein
MIEGGEVGCVGEVGEGGLQERLDIIEERGHKSRSA